MTKIREYPIPSEVDAARFWTKVDRSGGPVACWPWTAGKFKSGYGNFWMDGQASWRAHRVAYVICKGQIPNDMEACHTCDNPACCNPAHLFPGTHTDNIVDMFKKGRGNTAKGDKNVFSRRTDIVRRGESHKDHKLTEKSVEYMREKFNTGASISSLAKEFRLNWGTVNSAVRRITWAHVA